jgi:hypothetical protein
MKIQDSKSSNLTLSTSLFEELSEVELEAVSGGVKQDGLVNVNITDIDLDLVLAVQALTANSTQNVNSPMKAK